MVSQRGSQWRESLARPSSPAHWPRRQILAGLLFAALTLAACGGSRNRTRVKLPPPINPRIGWTETGVASWYGHPYHGRRTSNGETYDMNKMTAAHKRLPFDTWLQVENLGNGMKTRVRINDRGPFVGRRIVDLSRAAASEIRMIGTGTARVRLTVIRPPGQAQQRASGQGRRTVQAASRRQQGQFDIQVGVFASQANAQAMTARVRKWGHQTDIQEFSLNGQRRYRVLVLGGNRNQANSLMRTLKRRGVDGILRPRRGN